MTDAPEATRCAAHMGDLRCSLEYDHNHGHVYVGSYWADDKHKGN